MSIYTWPEAWCTWCDEQVLSAMELSEGLVLCVRCLRDCVAAVEAGGRL